MQSQFSIKGPTWVFATLAIGVAIGVGVAVLFRLGLIKPNQINGVIDIGFLFWALAGAICWAFSVKVEAVEADPKDYKPHLSGAEWKRQQDRERGWL